MEFEDLCFELWQSHWRDPQARKHGRDGQVQHGVDFYGRLPGDGGLEGVQCKVRRLNRGARLTERQVLDEVGKARGFPQELSVFTIATTAPRDAALQQLALRITDEQREIGSFSVGFAFWEDISDRLRRAPEVFARHYPLPSLEDPAEDSWLATLLAARTVEIKLRPETPRDPLLERLLESAAELSGDDRGEDPVRLVLAQTTSECSIEAPHGRARRRIHQIDLPADEVVLRWLLAHSFQGSTASVDEHFQGAPESVQRRYGKLRRKVLPIAAAGGSAQLATLPLETVAIGPPRIAERLGRVGESAEAPSGDGLEAVRRAVDRQDERGLAEALSALRPSAARDPHTETELELYRALLDLSRGRLSGVGARIAAASEAAPPEALVRAAMLVLSRGRISEVGLLVKRIPPEVPEPLRLIAQALELWIGTGGGPSSSRSAVHSKIDRLARRGRRIRAPATLWLCLARLALRFNDLERARLYLDSTEREERRSVEYLHVSALVTLQATALLLLERPARHPSAESLDRLQSACASLREACDATSRDHAKASPELWRDLALGLELVARLARGSDRSRHLILGAEAFERAARAPDSEPLLWARAGRCRLIAGDHRGALESYSGVPAESLDSLQRSDLAAAQLLTGHPNDAMVTLAALLDQELAPWQALFNAAIVLFLTGHLSVAAVALEQARARGGRASWKIEAMLGRVYERLGRRRRAEECWYQAVTARGAPDPALYRGFIDSFARGSAVRLRRSIEQLRSLFARHRANPEPLDRLDRERRTAVALYRNRLSQLESSGEEPPSVLVESLQQAFAALAALRHTRERLQELMDGRGRWSVSALIEQVMAVLSVAGHAPPSDLPTREVGAPEVVDVDWPSLHAEAQAALEDLPVTTSLIVREEALLAGLLWDRREASRVRAHQLALAARHLELTSSSALRCYQGLAAVSTPQPLLHKAYQERVVQRAFSRMQGRAILADEVGLGKTIEAGLILTEYRLRRLVRRCLVLVPTKDLEGQWLEELTGKLAHGPSGPWRARCWQRRGFEGWERADTWVATYSAALVNARLFSTADWDLIVADEAHRAANTSNKTHKLLKALGGRHLLLLTATPLQRGAGDLFALASLVRPGLLGSWRDFRRRFSDDALLRPRVRGELIRLLGQVMVRNTLLAVADQAFTGRRVFKNLVVELDPAEESFYLEATNLVLELGRVARGKRFPMEYYPLAQMAASSPDATLSAIGSMLRRRSARRSRSERLRLRRWYGTLSGIAGAISTPAKARLVRKILDEIAPRKALIFVQFRATASLLERVLGIRCIHGSMSASRRRSLLQAFERNAEERAVAATPGLAEGLNLAFCSVLINYDLPWNPMRIEQRIGRIQRLGQRHPEVLIYSLAAENTIEVEIGESLVRKVDLFRRVVGEIGLDLASVTHGRTITAALRAILKEARDMDDLRNRVRRFFDQELPPGLSGEAE